MTLFIFPLHLESGWELYLGALANLQAYCIMSPATPPGTSSIRNRESPQHAQTGSFHLRINLASTTGCSCTHSLGYMHTQNCPIKKKCRTCRVLQCPYTGLLRLDQRSKKQVYVRNSHHCGQPAQQEVNAHTCIHQGAHLEHVPSGRGHTRHHSSTLTPFSLSKPSGTQSTQSPFLHKTNSSRLGERAILINSQEQTQKAKRNGKTEEYAPNERTIKSPREKL